jgi:hypothetical protein
MYKFSDETSSITPSSNILDVFGGEKLEQKITRLCKHDTVTIKDLPTLVCIVQWQLNEATLPTNIGKVGDKIKITVEVITNREVLGVFGKYNELYLRSDDGQEYDWYSNRYFDICRGDKLELMGVIATVHQKYGRIRTRINYVKLLNRL